MATILAPQFESRGKLFCPPSNSLFQIEDPDSVWLVRSGTIDLFLVEVKDGEAFGARHHVMRISEGEAVLGIGSYLDGYALMASPSTGTELLWVQFADFLEIDPREGTTISLLDGWIMRWTSALCQDVAPGLFIDLQPRQSITLPEKSKALLSNHGVVWITAERGELSFLGNDEIAGIPNGIFFPVTKHGWLLGSSGTELLTLDSFALCELHQEKAGLEAFHRVALAFLADQRRKAAIKEVVFFSARRTADAKLLDSVLARLTTPMQKIREVLEGEESCHDPVFLACQKIGSILGIKIKPHPDMVRGLKMSDPVAAIASATGIRTRTVALKGQWWNENYGPLLAFTEENKNPVALLPRRNGGYEWVDPVARQRLRVTPDLASSLSPFARVLYRSFPTRKMSILDLLRFGLHSCKGELATIVLMGAAAGMLALVMPFATGLVFDRIIPGSERSQLIQLSGFLLVVAVAAALLTFVRGFAMLRLEGKLDASLQAAVWDRVLSLPVSFFRDYSSGDLAQRSLGISTIRQTLTGPTLTAILSGIFSIFSFALLFIYSVHLALLATALTAIAMIVSVVCGSVQVRRQREISKLSGRISSMLLQFLSGIAKFRVSGTENRAFAAWAREFARRKQLSVSSRRVMNTLTVFNSVFPTICLGLIFLYYQAFESHTAGSQITTGDFLAFLAAFMQFLAAALLLSSSIISALNIVPTYERAQPILQAIPEVTELKGDPGRLTGAVEVSQVVFRYRPDMPLVLRNVSVRIRPGQFVAFVGASGCGKSTLLRILLSFEAPESGAVYYDGHDLTGLDIQAVRRQIGVVLQSSRPISGSIFNNIVGSSPLTAEDAWEAARLAGIEEDIRRMPMGLHTHVSDGGGGISGGQRQRLMIARAIVGRPRILLFDEATSALDNHTQAVVSRSLESLQATRIVIAHRLSTIIKADAIFVMDQGQIVQSGTYAELVEQDGIFANLAKRQMA
jgi:NHLM bacteriocin system ABC transporter ATP-binding protein